MTSPKPYRECPVCGAALDPEERCDCEKGAKENAPAATGTPSRTNNTTSDISLSDKPSNVKDCLRLREIRERTGETAKDLASLVKTVFPKFNRQLMAQCEAWEKYGVIIHPDGARCITDRYNIPAATENAAEQAVITAHKPRNHSNRNLPRRITLRVSMDDYARIEQLTRESGAASIQAWLYEVVRDALREAVI